MKILHYFLGFPPYRTGGLTKYSFDLMKAQIDNGDAVLALWPGEIKSLGGKADIRYRGQVDGIINCEMINPLPVSLDEGIKEVEAFTAACDANVFFEFLEKESPDAIHIHTLMGLYKEFVDAAKKLKIRMVFTTHDYFGICPKVTMYKSQAACDNDHACADCVACNESALSLKKIQLMQSPLYRKMKNSTVVKALRKSHRSTFFAEEEMAAAGENVAVCQEAADKYQKLRKYYIDILSQIDMIHFNSSVTEAVYTKYFKPINSKIVSITHKDIVDRRQSESVESDILRISYLAPAKPFKGFSVLKKALDDLWESGNHSFEVKIFTPVENPSPYMKIKEDGYQYQELAQIFSETDVLLAPSVWYETFGFTVLEALSYGVPVIVSDHVGAKDIVGDGGMVIPAGSAEDLMEAVRGLSTEKLTQMKSSIRNMETFKSWDDFLKENYALYVDDIV